MGDLTRIVRSRRNQTTSNDQCTRLTCKLRRLGPHIHMPARDHLCPCGKPAVARGHHWAVEGRCGDHLGIAHHSQAADGTITPYDACGPTGWHRNTMHYLRSDPDGCPVCAEGERRRAAVTGGGAIPGVW